MSCVSVVKSFNVSVSEADLRTYIELVLKSSLTDLSMVREGFLYALESTLDMMDFSKLESSPPRSNLLVETVLGKDIYDIISLDGGYYFSLLRESNEVCPHYYKGVVFDFFSQYSLSLEASFLAKVMSIFYKDAHEFASISLNLDEINHGVLSSFEEYQCNEFGCSDLIDRLVKIPLDFQVQFENPSIPGEVFSHSYSYRKDNDSYNFSE